MAVKDRIVQGLHFRHRLAGSPALEPASIPATLPLATDEPSSVFWGDRLALWIWCLGFFAMAMVNILDMVMGLFKK